MKLIANKAMYYAGQTVPADATFDCEDKDVEILVLAQAARRSDDGGDGSRRKYKRRDMVAEGTR